MKPSVIVTLPPDLAAIAECPRVAVGEDEDGLFLVTREGESERLRCFNVHQEGVIDALARKQSAPPHVPRRVRKSKQTTVAGYGTAALVVRCPVCDADPGVGCITAPYSLGTRYPLRKPHRARVSAANVKPGQPLTRPVTAKRTGQDDRERARDGARFEET